MTDGAGGPHGAALARVAAALGPIATRDVPLGPFTTYRAGGPAAVLARIDNLGLTVLEMRRLPD